MDKDFFINKKNAARILLTLLKTIPKLSITKDKLLDIIMVNMKTIDNQKSNKLTPTKIRICEDI